MTKQQPSNKELKAQIKEQLPKLIDQAVEIAESGDNDSNRLGAIKFLMAKVLPDKKIKAAEIKELNKELEHQNILQAIEAMRKKHGIE